MGGQSSTRSAPRSRLGARPAHNCSVGRLLHDAVFVLRRQAEQRLAVLVAAERQDRDQQLTSRLDLSSRSHASMRSMIACRNPSAQSAAIRAPSRVAQKIGSNAS
jgi:hypothetical protein